MSCPRGKPRIQNKRISLPIFYKGNITQAFKDLPHNCYSCVLTTYLYITEPAHFNFGMGCKLGVFGVFQQSTMVCYVRMSPVSIALRSRHEDKEPVKSCMVRENHRHICFACVFACGVCKNLKAPNLSPMVHVVPKSNECNQRCRNLWLQLHVLCEITFLMQF